MFLFSFTFTAVYYYIAFIMSIVSAILVYKISNFRKQWYLFVISVVLLALSMAVYQVTLCMFLAFIVLLSIKSTLLNEKEAWRSFITRNIRYALCCILGLAMYLLSNNLALNIANTKLTDYQGMSSMFDLSVPLIKERILLAYKEFFLPSINRSYCYYFDVQTVICHTLIVFTLLFLVASYTIKAFKNNNPSKGFQLILLFAIFPLSTNSVFLTADPFKTRIHRLMTFSSIILFICLIFMIDILLKSETNTNRFILSLKKAAKNCATVLLLFILLHFSYYANVYYRNISIQQNETISYFNRLISRIENIENYDKNLKVAYINEYEKFTYISPNSLNNNIENIEEFGKVKLVNDYAWREYMSVWCGYKPDVLTDEEIEKISDKPEVKAMACYPDDGSIKIIDNTIVVKFSD